MITKGEMCRFFRPDGVCTFSLPKRDIIFKGDVLISGNPNKPTQAKTLINTAEGMRYGCRIAQVTGEKNIRSIQEDCDQFVPIR